MVDTFNRDVIWDELTAVGCPCSKALTQGRRRDPSTSTMSGRPARPARYRPGKAPAPERDEDSSDDEAPEAVNLQQEPLKLPSHTAVPQIHSAGVTIQRGDEAIRFPSGSHDARSTSPPPYKPQDEADVNLSEYGTYVFDPETDSEDDEADAPQPPPSRPAPAPAPEPAPSKMRPITAQPERRTPARAPAAVTLQATAVAPPAESEEETETETETESEETESEPEPVMLKPVFVSKYVKYLPRRDRTAAVDKPRNTTQQPDAEQKARKKAAHDLAAERVQRELREKKHEEATHDVDDTDDVDPDAEFAAWRLRELARIQRVQTQERQRREEREEVERRRALPEKQRLEEDLAYARRTRQEKQRGSQGFLQKYHHKGAFYQDMDILQRDYSQKTESAVNKAALPKIMQVRDFGKRSRSKWTYVRSTHTGTWPTRTPHGTSAISDRKDCSTLCFFIRERSREPVEARREALAGQRRAAKDLPRPFAERGEIQRV